MPLRARLLREENARRSRHIGWGPDKRRRPAPHDRSRKSRTGWENFHRDIQRCGCGRGENGGGSRLGPPGVPRDSYAILATAHAARDRKSVVSGKRVSVRVDPGGRRIIKKKKHKQ